MFPPAQSPNTQALFSQLGSGFATPGTLDFHRTAMNANKKADPFTSSAAPAASTITAAADSSAQATANQHNFDQHDAANGLFMLAQAGTESANNTYSQNKQDASRLRGNNGSVSNMSDATGGRDSAPSEEADQKPNTRNKGKKATGKNARKAEEAPSKPPPKKRGKSNSGIVANLNQFEEEPDSEEEIKEEDGDMVGKDGKKMTDEEKRKNFLERNRVAALKCRQRKKQWLANLQAKVEIFSSENDALSAQVAQLREEILNLKTILIAHKDCPIAQQQAAVGQYIPSHGPDYGAHANPYGNFQQPGQVMGAGGPRRYS